MKGFNIKDEGDLLFSLSFPDDPYDMNWVEGKIPWGTVKVPNAVGVSVKREYVSEHILRETYCFTNTSDFPILTGICDIGIYTPFNDNYEESRICLRNRCHAHIWCGGTSSYIMALRMGGEGPHLGLMLTRGSLEYYSVAERIEQLPEGIKKFELLSNDRGDFVLHPSPMELTPGESTVVEWELFRHDGKDDFYRILRTYPSFVEFEADKWVYFEGENQNITLKKREGQEYLKLVKDTRQIPRRPGETVYCVRDDTTNAWCRILSLPPLWELAQKRCTFIAEKQQFRKEGHPLDGAYLIYDTEEGHIVYNHRNDSNGGRERIGMGVLIAKYLQSKKDDKLEESLRRYTAFVLRELFNRETGQVYNDIGRCTDYFRLYNCPWAAQFFIELYLLWKDPSYLVYMYRAMLYFYKSGGNNFYAIGLPAYEGYTLLKKEGLREEAESFLSLFLNHADNILKNGTNYPTSEVYYEQSIVAPGTDMLYQAYRLNRDGKYLAEAKRHTEILSLFNGRQSDWCLYETSIRHWDGYWCGKERLLGDTFPHYWSALSAMTYWENHLITGDAAMLRMAEYSIRGVLGLFFPDGSASCAHLYPLTVNGKKGNFFDPFANDQDWGLYYNLKFDRKE
jgi:hypothetical protein